MAVIPLDQLIVTWTGFGGAPGYTNLYATPSGGVRAALIDLFTVFKQWMPSQVSMFFPSTGKQIDATNGDMIGSWSAGTDATLVGAQNGAWAAPVGTAINWTTATISHGKLIRGRTYFVPMSSVMFDNTGVLVSANRNTLNAAVNTFVTASGGNFAIWQRPWVVDGVQTRDGYRGIVTAGTVPNKAAVLTSRRA